MADAAIRGLLEIIQILVDYGANINALNMVRPSSFSLIILHTFLPDIL